MRHHAGYILIICCIILIPGVSVSSLIPDGITCNNTPIWVIAGDSTPSFLQIHVFNISNSSEFLPGIPVQLSLDDDSMGTLSTLSVTTDSFGNATASFMPLFHSGSVNITANITHTGNTAMIRQFIDHNTPYQLGTLIFPDSMTIGTIDNITASYVDQYNNFIDNRRDVEYISFSIISSPSSYSKFLPSNTTDITVYVDNVGNATANFRASDLAGLHQIQVALPGYPIASTPIWIQGFSNRPIKSISAEVIPEYLKIPADKSSVFLINYLCTDNYTQPSSGRQLYVNTSLGESRLLTSNVYGIASLYYGPMSAKGIVTLNATALDKYDSINHATNGPLNLQFTSRAPISISNPSGSPQNLPSYELTSGSKFATISAIVMDELGNGVSGENVTFSISNIAYNSKSTRKPSFDQNNENIATLNVLTDSDGYATAPFYPGSFITPDLEGTKSQCSVYARWNNQTFSNPEKGPLSMIWTNSPYLSVYTNVTPRQAKFGDIITVNIRVEGTGYKLQRKPIDAILTIDTSGSMAWKLDGSSTTNTSLKRITYAKTAAKNFVSQMNVNEGGDRIGVVPFGSTSSVRRSLSNDAVAINTTINGLTSIGATIFREAIYKSIQEIKSNGRDDAVRAIIALTDGEWNYDGHPLAFGTGWAVNSSITFSGSSMEMNKYRYYPGLGGTLRILSRTCVDAHDGDTCVEGTHDCSCTNNWGCTDGISTNQNMSVYAQSTPKNVSVYTIGFASVLNAGVVANLSALSTSTKATYTWAGDSAALNLLFELIAGKLKENAGINVNAGFEFEDIEITTNSTTNNLPGHEVFTYISPTTETKYWMNDTAHNPIATYPKSHDDTDNWLNDRMTFSLGSIKLNQSWETTFKLKLNSDNRSIGSINLFGNSIINFTTDQGTIENVTLPETYILCIGDQTPSQTGEPDPMTYEDLTATNTSTLMSWTFTRNFTRNSTPVTYWDRTWYEKYYISINPGIGEKKVGESVFHPPVGRSGSFEYDIAQILPKRDQTYQVIFRVKGDDFSGTFGEKLIQLPISGLIGKTPPILLQ